MDKETIIYLDGFADGLNMANNSTNKMLDKIRAEIDQLHLIGYATINGKREIASRAVMQIIDKYKIEIGVEDGNVK